jgi:hypothetical protein
MNKCEVLRKDDIRLRIGILDTTSCFLLRVCSVEVVHFREAQDWTSKIRRAFVVHKPSPSCITWGSIGDARGTRKALATRALEPQVFPHMPHNERL